MAPDSSGCLPVLVSVPHSAPPRCLLGDSAETSENARWQARAQNSFHYSRNLQFGLSDSSILENDAVSTASSADSRESENERRQTRTQDSFSYAWDLHLGFSDSSILENEAVAHPFSDSRE